MLCRDMNCVPDQEAKADVTIEVVPLPQLEAAPKQAPPLESTVDAIGSADPVKDFQSLLAAGHVEVAIAGMRAVISDLVSSSINERCLPCIPPWTRRFTMPQWPQCVLLARALADFTPCCAGRRKSQCIFIGKLVLTRNGSSPGRYSIQHIQCSGHASSAHLVQLKMPPAQMMTKDWLISRGLKIPKAHGWIDTALHDIVQGNC